MSDKEQEIKLTTEDWAIVVKTMSIRIDKLERSEADERKAATDFCDMWAKAEEELAAAKARIVELERQPAVTRAKVREAARQVYGLMPLEYAERLCDRLGIPDDPTE